MDAQLVDALEIVALAVVKPALRHLVGAMAAVPDDGDAGREQDRGGRELSSAEKYICASTIRTLCSGTFEGPEPERRSFFKAFVVRCPLDDREHVAGSLDG